MIFYLDINQGKDDIDALWIGVPGCFFSLFILYRVMLFVRRKQSDQARRIMVEHPAEKIVAFTTAVNFIGLASGGSGQIRGNGELLSTPDFFLFERMIPKQRWQIPIHSLRQVDLAPSFLGKRCRLPVVRIHFLDDNGQSEQMGLLIKEPEKWKNLILSML